MIVAFLQINFESMKYLFIVQGEGRGHMTQAMTLERMLLDRGHEVVGIMVGKSPIRKVPEFLPHLLRNRMFSVIHCRKSVYLLYQCPLL